MLYKVKQTMKRIILYTLLLITVFLSCNPDNSLDEFNSIDPELAPYIQRFVEEGANRGINISTERLVASFLSKDIVADGFCGLGGVDFNDPDIPVIEIVDSDLCWHTADEYYKEALIFHELGHAILERFHDNTIFPNGSITKSIMCGGGGNCSFPGYFEKGLLRDYYIDELFKPDTPSPDFLFEEKTYLRTVYQENFENYREDWETFILEDDANIDQYIISIDSANTNPAFMPNSLAVSNQIEMPEDAIVIVLRRFDLTDFNTCSNLKATANIRTEGLTDGNFEMTLSLRERLSDGTLSRFYANTIRESSFNSDNNVYEDFELELYCIPNKSDVVTISFSMVSKTPATLFIDDVKVDLYE